MSNLRKTLKELARLSMLANRISETQAKNLQMFPFVFFEGVKEVKVEYDLGHGYDEKDKAVKHKSEISYHLTVDDDGINEAYIGLEKRCKATEIAVRELFWNNIKVSVHMNDKVIYESDDV